MKSRLRFIVCASVLLFSMASVQAGEFLKCEKRNNPQRSQISVQSEGLVSGAVYSATVVSGNHSAVAMAAADLGGKVEYDFDSNMNDILAGATQIGSNFIVKVVSATVKDALGNVVDSGSAVCKLK